MKKISSYLNIILLVLALLGPVWFIASVHTVNESNSHVLVEPQLKQFSDTTKIAEKKPESPIHWEGLIPSITALITFILKYYWYDRKQKVPKLTTDESHPLFTELEQSLFNIKSISFGNPGRTDMFRVMLSEQHSIFAEQTRKFVLDKEEFKSTIDFRTQCRQLITSITKAYEDRWVQLGIPEVVITKVRNTYQGRLELVMSDIDTIAFYRAENNYDDALFYILTSILFMLKFGTTLDSIKLLKELNGELKGYKFNNKELS